MKFFFINDFSSHIVHTSRYKELCVNFYYPQGTTTYFESQYSFNESVWSVSCHSLFDTFTIESTQTLPMNVHIGISAWFIARGDNSLVFSASIRVCTCQQAGCPGPKTSQPYKGKTNIAKQIGTFLRYWSCKHVYDLLYNTWPLVDLSGHSLPLLSFWILTRVSMH